MVSKSRRRQSGDGGSNRSSSHDQVKAAPHFFKIIHSSVVPHQKLRIPMKFISQYGKNLGNHVFLKVPSGAVSKLELEKSNGVVWMRNGWKEFAKHYSIGYGHLLVFRYDGNCNFNVLIFDTSASEIEYPVKATHGEQTNLNGIGNSKIPVTEGVIEIDDSVETLGDVPCATYNTKKEEIYGRGEIEKVGIRTRQKTRQASNYRGNIEKDVSVKILDDSYVRDFPVSERFRGDMGSSRPSSPVKPSPPHFFKIIHSPLQNLKIPRKFTTTYGKDLANHVFVKVPDGMVWKVELIKSDEDAWLCNGWKEFAEHYSVCFGHFLVFRYDGDSDFHVIIFDMTASEIEYPFSATRGDETDANHLGNSQVPDTEEIEVDDYGKITSTELKLPIPNKKEAVKRQESRRGLSVAKRPRHYPFTVKKPFSSGNGKALERARAFRSENPYFTKIMTPSFVSTGYKCYLPTKFSKENLSEKPEKVVLQNANGVWPVKCYYGGPNGYFLYWKSFVQANNVKANDVCVFELIKSIEPRLNVVIFQKYRKATALEE